MDGDGVAAQPPWFVPREHLTVSDLMFAPGLFGGVYRGRWLHTTKVVVRKLEPNDDDPNRDEIERQFLRQIELWATFHHPNILQMYGACHIGTPKFMFCEDAVLGDMGVYLARSAIHRQRLWRLLHQVAQGLRYLHSINVVHGNLNLSSVLIGGDKCARITGFGLSRKVKTNDRVNELDESSTQELSLSKFVPASIVYGSTFESDIYALAICILEASTGQSPFSNLAPNEIQDLVRRRELPERPKDAPDDAWELVVDMTKADPDERLSLDDALAQLKRLADLEELLNDKVCGCGLDLDPESKYCLQCGAEQDEDLSIHSREDIKRCVQMLETASEVRRINAAKALANYAFDSLDRQQNVAAASGITRLIKLLRHSNDEVKIRAAQALGAVVCLNESLQVTAADEGAVQALLKTLRTGSRVVQQRVVWVLCLVIDSDAVDQRTARTLLQEMTESGDRSSLQNPIQSKMAPTGQSRFHVACSQVLRLLEISNREEFSSTKFTDLGALLSSTIEDGDGGLLRYLVAKGARLRDFDDLSIPLHHIALRQRNFKVLSFLIKNGVSVNAVGVGKDTALQLAIKQGDKLVVEFLLQHGADVFIVDENEYSPLCNAIFSDEAANRGAERAYDIVRLLCEHGAKWDSSCKQQRREVTIRRHAGASLAAWQLGLSMCSIFWSRGTKMDVPVEVVKRGEDSVKTFLAERLATKNDELVYRRKICVVGPSMWGKSSLVRSLVTGRPSLVNLSDRTIGIDLYPMAFTEEDDGHTIKHEATMWDFAGQDVYQVAHSVFFSERTLYLLCIDLAAYARAIEEANQEHDQRIAEAKLYRFTMDHICNWVRLILVRQPDAEFFVVGTKADKLTDDQVKRVKLELRICLGEFLRELERESSTTMRPAPQHDEHTVVVEKRFAQLRRSFSECLVVSCATVDAVTEIQAAVKAALIAKRGFEMPKTYTSVLEEVRNLQRDASKLRSPEMRNKALITTMRTLCSTLVRKIPSLTYDQCINILRTLHDLGDVLVYEQIHSGVDFVILDPTVLIDFVREVVDHNHQESGQYDELRSEGLLRHSQLKKFPLWSTLDDDEVIYLMKLLLQQNQLAYPADNQSMDATSDLIVPSYWKAKAEIESGEGPHAVTRLSSTAFEVGWQYTVPSSVSEIVFDQFAVQSYTTLFPRSVGPTWVLVSVREEFNATIVLIPGPTRHDLIRLSVSAHGKTRAWECIRFFIMAMEIVLAGYPGLHPSRHIIDEGGTHSVSDAVKLFKDSAAMGRDITQSPEWAWLPAELDWFSEKAWEKPGVLKEIAMRASVHQVSKAADTLKNLVVSGDRRRRFPALWTLAYAENASIVQLRMLSDESGVCYHEPILIQVPSRFLAQYGGWIQTGLSILSTISSTLIPMNLVQEVADLAKSAIDDPVLRAQSIHNMIGQLDQSSDDFQPAKDHQWSEGRSVYMLRELLKLHNAEFDELMITELSKLQCAFTPEGYYVWVSKDEIRNSDGRLTPCDQEDLWIPSSPGSSSASTISTSESVTSTRVQLFVLDIKGLDNWDWHKAYCRWEIVYDSGVSSDFDRTVSASNNRPSTWKEPFRVRNAKTLGMLRGAILRVQAKRSSRMFGLIKELGKGQIDLKDYLETTYEGSEPHEVSFSIPLESASHPRLAVECAIAFTLPDESAQGA